MNHEELLKRLCALVSQVGATEFASQFPHDCFCVDYPTLRTPIVDERIVEYIEDAVAKQLRRDTSLANNS